MSARSVRMPPPTAEVLRATVGIDLLVAAGPRVEPTAPLVEVRPYAPGVRPTRFSSLKAGEEVGPSDLPLWTDAEKEEMEAGGVPGCHCQDCTEIRTKLVQNRHLSTEQALSNTRQQSPTGDSLVLPWANVSRLSFP